MVLYITKYIVAFKNNRNKNSPSKTYLQFNSNYYYYFCNSRSESLFQADQLQIDVLKSYYYYYHHHHRILKTRL